jgi:3-deoxy-7-phosphoheptulonate synthase
VHLLNQGMSNNHHPYQLAGFEWKGKYTEIDVNGSKIGGNEICIIAGPCAVESEEQIGTIASFLSKLGVKFLRGGAYKPRTSPYAFQGLKKEGLKLLKQQSEKHGLNIVTEVMDLSLLDEVYPYTDIIQVGTRNMKNYQFLKELGKVKKPVLLKRGMDATIEEWLLAAEYILLGGNEDVILCERGIRTFDHSTRNTLDLSAVPQIKHFSHLPVIVDPSQGTGIRELVVPMSLAAIAAGSDGLMIEIHNNPEHALSDGPQSLYPEDFAQMIPKLKKFAEAAGRTIGLQGKMNSETVKL